jgi:hypothetical protein
VNWLSDNYKWLFDGVAGAAIIGFAGYLLTRWTASQKYRTDMRAEGSSVSHSPIVGGTHNSQVAPIIHAENVHFAAVATPGAASTRVSTRERPNIEYVGPREKVIFVSPTSTEGIGDPKSIDEREKALQCLVLQFENKILSDRTISRARNVIAKMNFRSENGTRSRSISYGVWLNSPCNSTAFGIGDTQELVLMSSTGEDLFAFDDRRSPGHSFYDEFSYFEHCDVEGLRIVDVTVIDKDTQVVLFRKFKVLREGARFRVAVL